MSPTPTKLPSITPELMDQLIASMKPSDAGDGSRQIVLPLYNTQVSIKAYPGSKGLDAARLDDALIAARDLAITFEKTMSRTRPASDISRLNKAGGAHVTLEPHVADLLARSLGYCAASDGFYDITMGAVTPLWDFHQESPRIADPRALAAGLEHVGYTKVHVDPATCEAWIDDPDAMVDLGGIAKGYIADQLAGVLIEHGCDCAFVNLGGNVLTVGARPTGEPWRVGVRDPKDPATIRAVVEVVGKSVVTSGLYERCFTLDGTFYHHILDPRDGMPVATDIAGATIVSDLSLDGDGYSTALFAMGVTKAMEFIAAHEGLEAIVIDRDDQVHVSEGLKDSVRLVQTAPRNAPRQG